MRTDRDEGDSAMSGMHVLNVPKATIRICRGLAILAMALTVLAGCATGGRNLKPADDPHFDEVKGPPVARLEEGREGFLISEVSRMDEASRRDFTRAVALLHEADFTKAIEILAKLIERSPGVTAPYINIAIAYRQTGNPELAEDHLKTALEMVPGHPAASNEYGLLLRKSGRFAEARAIFEEALLRFPEYYPVHRNLGILCDLYLNDLACAVEHYEAYSHAQPEDRQVEIWIADLRARLGRD